MNQTFYTHTRHIPTHKKKRFAFITNSSIHRLYDQSLCIYLFIYFFLLFVHRHTRTCLHTPQHSSNDIKFRPWMFTEQLTHLLNETFIKVIWQMRIWLNAKILRQRNCFIPTCCNHVELCKFHTRVFGSHYTRRIWREDSNIITNIGMHSLWIMLRVSVSVFATNIWEQPLKLEVICIVRR